MKRRLAAIVLAVSLTTLSLVGAGERPPGFADLRAIDPTIRQDIRYATDNNFTRSVVPGYVAPACILAEPVAKALAQVQKALKPQQLGLQVFDCYRPSRAVKFFVAWASEKGKPDPEYYPEFARNTLIAKGYIAARSGHSSGGSIDLTLGKLTPTGFEALDMGTDFDFFDPRSHTRSKAVSAEALANRQLLVKAMQQAGFANYDREWWHFSFRKEPFAGKAFDFDVRE
ncbi:hypothetical protein DEM27_13805 [Metarhizobium album]|uniref:D-alanyl-D-alanine dipeptidase n=1 Tax=Metarhizobium album TaxID=2182425 RepID=A0A2U2DR20_9HYPH|nr:M15 family metallopeptidase [Rhizobium album]PWE55747.1 hypothetical protein DEM27_13805 [Rhizobium album]